MYIDDFSFFKIFVTDVTKEEHVEVRPKDITNVTQKERTTVPKGVYDSAAKRAYFNFVLLPSFTS